MWNRRISTIWPGASPLLVVGGGCVARCVAARSGKADGSRLGGAAAAGAAAARGVVGDLEEVLGVRLDDVDLPGLLAGAGDPDLVLQRVAAGRVVLLDCGQSGDLEPVGRLGDLVGGGGLDAEV